MDIDLFGTYPKNFKHQFDKILERFQGVFKFGLRQPLRAKIGMQIWFSAGNTLALYHRLRAVFGTAKMSCNFTFLGVPTSELRKGKKLKINQLTLKPNHLNSFGWK